MFPISGSFQHFRWELDMKKDLCEGHTIGLLFVDITQTSVRSYLTNYLDVFNEQSGRFIDFYIPGYKRSKRDSSDPNIHIGDVYWNFEPKLYKAFQLEMEQNYDIPFSSTAYLLLMEVGSPGNFKRVLKIGLEGNGKDIRDVAEFFRESFEYSKKEIAFEEISNWILKKENLKERSENLQKIYKILGNVAITSVIKTLFFA